jgi:polyisoprenoid-binding protein YceI
LSFPTFSLTLLINTRFHITLFILFAGLFVQTAATQDITLDREESRLWIEGSSNVNKFQCRAGRYQTQVAPPTSDTSAQVEVDVAVEGFDCGKRRMNRDLYSTLLSNRHPYISFEYLSTESMEFDESSGKYMLRVRGNLTVAGHTNKIEFPLEATFVNDNRILATGQTTLKMTSYNVEPPSALLGLVRVNDELTVHFELAATVNNLELPGNGKNQE